MRRGLLAVLLGVACGGAHESAPVVVAPPPPPPVVLPAPEVEQAPRPLPPPYDAFHVAHPQKLFVRLEALLRPVYPDMPPLDADTVAVLLTGDRVGSIVDLEQPIDMLIFDKDRLAGRVGMRAGAAPLLRERLHAVDAGGGKLRFGSGGRSCEARGTEMVCASSGEVLALTAPYLRASAREAPASSDVHSLLVLPGTPVAPTSNDAAGQVVGTFVGAMSELALDLSTRGSAAELTASARFSSVDSPLARSLLAAPQNVPLEAFRKLPADARVALVTTGLRADALAPFREDAGSAMADSLTSDGYPPDYVAEGAAALKELVLTGGPFVMAAGFDQAALERAAAGYRAAATDKTRAAVRAALTGYLVAGVEEEPARWVKGIRHLVELDNRHVRKIQKPAGGDATKDKPKDADTWSCASRLAALPRGVPRDGLHVELVCHLKAQPKTVRTTRLLVIPDGHRTWLLYGADLAYLTAKAAGLLDARAATLATRKDVERCVAGPSTLCATFSLLAGVPFFDATTDAEIAASLARFDRIRAQPSDPSTVVLGPAGGDRLGVSAVTPLRAIAGLLSLLSD